MKLILFCLLVVPFALTAEESLPVESGLRGTTWVRSDWGGGPADISFSTDGRSFKFADNRGMGYIVSCTRGPAGYSLGPGITTWLLQILASDGSYNLMVFHVGRNTLRMGYSFYTPDDLGEYTKQ